MQWLFAHCCAGVATQGTQPSDLVESSQRSRCMQGNSSYRELSKFFSLDSKDVTSLLPDPQPGSEFDQVTTCGLVLAVLRCWPVSEADALLAFMMVLHQSEKAMYCDYITVILTCGMFYSKKQKLCSRGKCDMQEFNLRTVFSTLGFYRFRSYPTNCCADKALSVP